MSPFTVTGPESPALGVAALHVVAALACARAARREDALPGHHQAHAFIWPLATVGLALLALNGLWHLDRIFVLELRDAAAEGGWYALRRPLQVAALGLLACAAAFALPRALRTLRATPPATWLAAAGLAMLLTLTVLRLVSLHHTDRVLDARLVGLSLGRWTEGLALALVIAGATQTGRRPTRAADGPPLRAWPGRFNSGDDHV